MSTATAEADRGPVTSPARSEGAPGKSTDAAVAVAVMPFDFRTPQRLQELHLRLIQNVHVKFSESFAAGIHAKLQFPVSVAVRDVEQIYYGDFIPAGDPHACYYLMRMTEVQASGLLALDATTVIALVARMLGASDEGTIKSRRITRLEQSVVKGIVHQAVDALSAAWKGVVAHGVTFDRLANDAEIARLMPSNEILVVVTIGIVLAGQEYFIKACYPASAVEHILFPDGDSEDEPGGAKHEEYSSVLLSGIGETGLTVAGVLGTIESTMRDLVNLEPGDILRLEGSVSDEIEVVIDGKTRFWGRAGISNGRLAAIITRVCGNDQHEGV